MTVWGRAVDLLDAPPLVAYRAAICDTLSLPALDRVRTLVPEFAEAALFLARPAVRAAVNDGGGRAGELLAEARARFPESPSINYLSGNLSQLTGDCAGALDFYDKTLARRSTHEDALLGRTTCLTFLKRPDEAIAEATHMIDLPTDNWGQAFYWRAWNLHAKKQFPPARADIERASASSPSRVILPLAVRGSASTR